MFKFLRQLFGYVMFLWLGATSLCAEDRPSINILTWWGYFEHPGVVEMIEEECGITLSYDEYSSNAEFLRRLAASANNYDIVIFSNTIHHMAKRYVDRDNIDISSHSLDFHPIVKSVYDKGGYSKNIQFLAHSVPVFMWDPKSMSISADQTIQEIFDSAGKGKVFMFNDEHEIAELLSRAGKVPDGSRNLDIEAFFELVKDASVYVTNDPVSIADYNDFAFMYTWSGDAFLHRRNARSDYQVLVHPQCRYISTELIGLLCEKTEAKKVVSFMLSDRFTATLQDSTYFISPRFNPETIKETSARLLYERIAKDLHKFDWLPAAAETDLTIMQNHMKWVNLRLTVREPHE